jgi:hypothetical protein
VGTPVTGCLQNVKKTDISLCGRLSLTQYNHNNIIQLFAFLSMMSHGIFLAVVLLRKKSQISTPGNAREGSPFLCPGACLDVFLVLNSCYTLEVGDW